MLASAKLGVGTKWAGAPAADTIPPDTPAYSGAAVDAVAAAVGVVGGEGIG